MEFSVPAVTDTPHFSELNAAYRCDEAEHVRRLLEAARLAPEARERVADRARTLVHGVRRNSASTSGIDAFMHEYELSSQEGVVLMCLAEALLRVPDAETVDKLIEDKLGSTDWESHLGKSESLFVNASTWALMLTGRLLRPSEGPERNFRSVMQRMVRRSGEPVIRQAVRQAMRIMGRQFVMGRNIDEALRRARDMERRGYRYSYDMLGEAARTDDDAERYLAAYRAAIEAIGKVASGRGPITAPGISVKLSALHPRYELAHRDSVLERLVPRLQELTRMAAKRDINLCIDAEEASRLDLSFEILELAAGDRQLGDWQGLGLALQAYQKRAFAAVDWLADMAARTGRRLMVRLVKGAYWDTEVKIAQEQGLDGYPVFTRKANTDVSYLACARKLLADPEHFYPQFATHNAHSVAAVMEMAGANRDFEFQRLHGMGEELYDQLVGPGAEDLACRIYAPVGSHEELLAYLVRRLLENGANTSFVNRIVDEKTPVDEIIADPVSKVAGHSVIAHPRIPLPRNLYGPSRANSRGVDLTDLAALRRLAEGMAAADRRQWRAVPLIGGVPVREPDQPVTSPADRRREVGRVGFATGEDVARAMERAHRAQPDWDDTPASERAACLERIADLYEQELPTLVALCAREAGKHVPDGVAEVREAVDFCRYYALQAREHFAGAMPLPGPTGERNQLSLHGRGVFACISPWNFPLAIFTGQVSAALASGNAVIAKPAEQTSLIGGYAVELMHRAGIPPDVLQFIPGDGPTVGTPLVSDPRLAGIAFTGSVETAKLINRKLAERDGPIVPMIAETGGQNAMIVDSTALLEQVVPDIIKSSFQSAGQRCSALRVLFVQEEIAEELEQMLAGAMAELAIGDPWQLATDVTPVIDDEAREMLEGHARHMDEADHAGLIHACELPEATAHGTFVAPRAYRVRHIDDVGGEHFGPILHVIHFKARKLDAVIDQINGAGYGLTFGIHTRIDTTAAHVTRRIMAGNAYVNRNMIGAVVGVHPFGGERLSGTGPKAGGPHYLFRFAIERALSVDTTAAGGNASLMSMEDEPDSDAGPLMLPEPQRYAR